MQMADIFISYAREDEARIRDLVVALEQQRWSVFWDRQIPAGQSWHGYIGQALMDARCVIVAWSHYSLASQFVIEEAEEGKQRGILVPVLLDPVQPPFGFRTIHSADLTEWRLNLQSLQLLQLIKDIEGVLNKQSPLEYESINDANPQLISFATKTHRPIKILQLKLLLRLFVSCAALFAIYLGVKGWLSAPTPKSNITTTYKPYKSIDSAQVVSEPFAKQTNMLPSFEEVSRSTTTFDIPNSKPQVNNSNSNHKAGLSTPSLLQALAKKYKEQKQQAVRPPADQWTSQPMTLSFLGVRCSGNIPEQEETERFFTAQLSQKLHSSDRVRLVERERLNAILEELQVTTADIADQNMAVVMLGKLLGAQLICLGEIVELKGEATAYVRVFETDTSNIVISLQEEIPGEKYKQTIDSLARSLTQKIERLYPARGIITQNAPDEITINIGTAAGMKPGAMFAVLADSYSPTDSKTKRQREKRIGTLQIKESFDNYSVVTIRQQTEIFKEGMRIIEILD